MHVHSEYSPDSSNKIEEIAEKAGRLGIGVAVTDHNRIEGAVKLCKLKKVLVIPGIEVNSSEGLDLLFYFEELNRLVEFYEKIVLPNKKKNRFGDSKMPALDLLKEAKMYNGLGVIAHPYRITPRKLLRLFFSRKIKKIAETAEAIEAANSSCSKANNKKASELAKKINKSMVGGSDSHKIKTIGQVLTCVKDGKNVQFFLKQIRMKKNLIIKN